MKTPNNLTGTENRLGVTRGRGQDEMCKGGQLNVMHGIRLLVVSSLWWARSPVIMYTGNFNDVENQCYLNKEKRMKNWVTNKQSLQSHSPEISTFCIFRGIFENVLLVFTCIYFINQIAHAPKTSCFFCHVIHHESSCDYKQKLL